MDNRWRVEIYESSKLRGDDYAVSASSEDEAREKGLKLLVDEHPLLMGRELELDVTARLIFRKH